MLAFGRGAIRQVDVPRQVEAEVRGDVQNLLNAIYQYGQNDIQPVVGIPSVSCGDLIYLEDGYYLVASFGFRKITLEQARALQTAQDIQTSKALRGFYDMFWRDLVAQIDKAEAK